MTSINNPFLGRDLQEKLARQTSEKITHKTWSLLKCFSVVVVIVAVCCFWFFRCFFPKRSTLNNELFAQNTWQFPKLWRLQPFGLKHAVFNCFRTESLYRAVASMEQDETIASSWVWPFMKKRFIEKKKIGVFKMQPDTALEDEQQSDAKQIKGLPQEVSHCTEQFLSKQIWTILQLLLPLSFGSCSCERSFSPPRSLKTVPRTSMANAKRAYFSVRW